MTSIAWVLAFGLLAQAAPDAVVIRIQNPSLELPLPAGYEEILPRTETMQFVRSAGPELWAKVMVSLRADEGPIPQIRSGVTVAQIRPHLPLPPGSQETFTTISWRNLQLGMFEFRGVDRGLPVVGLATLLPLKPRAACLIAFAPEPLEKAVRADFAEILSRITKFKTNWHTPTELQRIDDLERLSMAGWGMMTIYPIAWIFHLRRDPMHLHWVRTGWLAIAALLLFAPISSPAESETHLDLLGTILMPAILMSFVIRRLKMAVEQG